MNEADNLRARRLALAVLLVSVVMGCDDAPEAGPPPVVTPPATTAPEVETPAPETEPARGPTPENSVFHESGDLDCARHDECLVLEGRCGARTPSNASSAPAVQRRIEGLGRYGLCGNGSFQDRPTTPACAGGYCRVLEGTPEEHACAEDTDCVVVEGRCDSRHALNADARDAFLARAQAEIDEGAGCGYGERPTAIRAVCRDALCVPEPEG